QWQHRLAARQELTISVDHPVERAMEALDQRRRPSASGSPTQLQRLSAMARRGFVRYMERDVMLEECGGWRIGYGSPAPLDLLTGMGSLDLIELSLDLLQRLLLGESRWVFVSASSPMEPLESLASALEPLEFAIVSRLHTELFDQAMSGNYP